MKDDQSLATYLANEGFFYYLDFTSKKENEPLLIEVKNLSDSNNELSPILSDTEISLRRSAKTRHIPNKYGIIAQHLAMSTFVQEVIHEPLIYYKALRFLETAKW